MRWAAMKWSLVVLLSLHGPIHVIGFVTAWGLADIHAISAATTVPLGATELQQFGLVWLAASLALVASAMLLVLGHRRWVAAALAGVALSQVVIVLWWPDAWVGTLANLIIVIIVATLAWRQTIGARVA